MTEPAAVRVVSLVPSATETLVALGADVVACTRFCEQPSLQHVGGTKNPDIAVIAALHPDVIVMDVQENRVEDAEELRRRGLVVHATDVCDLAGALDVVDQLATLAGVTDRSAAVRRVEPAAPPRVGSPMRRAFVPIWRRPWMALGNGTYGASLLAHLGVELDVGGSDDPYPEVELADLDSRSIDVVLIPSEPYDFSDSHLEEVSRVLPGVPIRRVDGQDLFWWGIRTPGALRRLAAELE